MNTCALSETIVIPQKFAQHLNEHMHTFGSLENITKILNYRKKGPHINNVERFYIHKEAAFENELNDKRSFPIKSLTLS